MTGQAYSTREILSTLHIYPIPTRRCLWRRNYDRRRCFAFALVLLDRRVGASGEREGQEKVRVHGVAYRQIAVQNALKLTKLSEPKEQDVTPELVSLLRFQRKGGIQS